MLVDFLILIPIAQQEEMHFPVSSGKFHKIQDFDSIIFSFVTRWQNFKLAVFPFCPIITHQEIPQKTEKSESYKKESG